MLETIGSWLLKKASGTVWSEIVTRTRDAESENRRTAGFLEEIDGAVQEALQKCKETAEPSIVESIELFFSAIDSRLSNSNRDSRLVVQLSDSNAERFLDPIAQLFHASGRGIVLAEELADRIINFNKIYPHGSDSTQPSLESNRPAVVQFCRDLIREIFERLQRRFPEAAQLGTIDDIRQLLIEIRNLTEAAALDAVADRDPQFVETWKDEQWILIADRTRDFTGREHVFDAFNRFLDDEPCGYFTVLGDPGEGKTAILAERVKRTGCIAHFNTRSHDVTRPGQFISALESQLTADQSSDHPSDPDEREASKLQRLLTEAAKTIEIGKPLVIVVDALDESELAARSSGANILWLPQVVPENVFFLMSCRRMNPPLVPFIATSPQCLYDLGDHIEECEEDIRSYLRFASKRQGIADWTQRRNLTQNDFVDLLAQRSGRNFMYLRHVLPEIERGTYLELETCSLPAGLEGYYEDHWERMGMTATPVPRDRILTLYMLCKVVDPISLDLLTTYLQHTGASMDAIVVQQVLSDWRPFLHQVSIGGQTRYSIYHESFRDFLFRRDVMQAAGLTLDEINTIYAESLQARLFDLV